MTPGTHDGRRAIVTGATSGVGFEIAEALAGEGAHVIIPARNQERADAARCRIRTTHPGASLEIAELDLARLASVRAFAERLHAAGDPIELFVINAGVVLLGDPERHVSDDGFELHFQTNFLAHAALTTQIMPLLQAGRARVVVQLSLAAGRGRLHDPQCLRRYSALRAYTQSKLALGMWGVELARRVSADGVTVHLCHPGVVPETGIAADLRDRANGFSRRLANRLGGTPAQGARPALTALRTDAPSGRLFVPRGLLGMAGPPRERAPYRSIADPERGAAVWAMAERMLAAVP